MGADYGASAVSKGRWQVSLFSKIRRHVMVNHPEVLTVRRWGNFGDVMLCLARLFTMMAPSLVEYLMGAGFLR